LYLDRNVTVLASRRQDPRADDPGNHQRPAPWVERLAIATLVCGARGIAPRSVGLAGAEADLPVGEAHGLLQFQVELRSGFEDQVGASLEENRRKPGRGACSCADGCSLPAVGQHDFQSDSQSITDLHKSSRRPADGMPGLRKWFNLPDRPGGGRGRTGRLKSCFNEVATGANVAYDG